MAKLPPFGPFRAFDGDGNPLAGGKLYTYEAKTTTPKATYTDASEQTANSNPIILDDEGYASLWLGSGAYKLVLKNANDVDVWPVALDDVSGEAENAFGSNVVEVDSSILVNSPYANATIVVTSPATLTLMPASDAREGFYFSVKNTSEGAVIIDPDASEQIDGVSTVTLENGSSCIVICDGATWRTLFLQNVFLGSANTFTGNNAFQGNVTLTGRLITPDESELTIASGAITVTGIFHTIDTESNAASDDLETINGGSDGQRITLRTEDSARDVVLKTTGNIALPADVTLSATNGPIELIYDDALAKWLQLGATATQGNKADTAVQPANIPSLVTFTQVYTSPDQSISNGGGATLTHGLTSKPLLFRAYLKCTTAEYDYAIGDEVDISSGQIQANNDSGYGVFCFTRGATEIRYRVGALGVFVMHATSGVRQAATLANWRIIIRAWA